ncbi:hypothetical protein ACH5RR_011896 [Cinchona calisaya]|uniref:FYVE-type domain-containing protein n=1 Tax=Cinchona calisaya TaxID=153742 RepID=A0ABD3A661_9GENT
MSSYYQPHFQNPNPIPHTSSSDHPQFNPTPNSSTTTAGYASAPPLSSNYSPSADFSPNYSSSSSSPAFPPPPYSQTSDQHHALPSSSSFLNPNLTSSQLSSNPNHPSYSFPHLDPPSYSPYDHNPSYTPPPPYSTYSSSASYESYAPAGAHNYESSFGNNVNVGGYGNGDQNQGFYDDIAGVFKYDGGKSEPYGARGNLPVSGSGSGSGSASDTGVIFDDYGRPINVPSQNRQNGGSGSFPKIVKAAPKAEEQHDSKGSVQKYRVKLLSEAVGRTDSDVLCQIGLDGIRILDPPTSRTLKIYPLESVTRWDVLDSYIFAFWAKSSVDVEPRRIRLKSNSYTTNNILDTVTAASIQVKEMGGTSKSSDAIKDADQPAEKKAFIGWRNLMKPGTEEKDHWVPDEAVNKCIACSSVFSAFNRKHHCRNCGHIFCDKCTQGRIALMADENAHPVRVCDRCLAEVTQRLSNIKEAATKVVGAQSHEELVRKLKEEMEKNRKTSTGLTSYVSETRMREVACPTCTVHLQVQVPPASGSETIECSVCQHPFLVGAH